MLNLLFFMIFIGFDEGLFYITAITLLRSRATVRRIIQAQDLRYNRNIAK